MTITEKKATLIAELSAIKNSQERFSYLISRSKKLPALETEFKTDGFRVEGCLAKLWFVSDFREGRCYFHSDSDSAIVKSVASLLCDFYSDQPPEEIISTDPSFLESVGISQHLTQNRRNSLTKIWERIRSFAAQQIA